MTINVTFELHQTHNKMKTKHYKIKTDTCKKWLQFLIEVKPLIKEAYIFNAGIGEVYLTCRGEYNDSPYPSETDDFDSIVSRHYNYTHYTLASKPQPEKRWLGKWITIDEVIIILKKVLK